MVNMKVCEKVGCGIEFDLDVEGVIVTKLENKQFVKQYYCCKEHR